MQYIGNQSFSVHGVLISAIASVKNHMPNTYGKKITFPNLLIAQIAIILSYIFYFLHWFNINIALI
jgi:hypothetical protein